MVSITEFLEARIAEDEALARSVLATVAPDEWENPTKWGNFYPADIAFWDAQSPYRVLAECAAKRAIIARYVQSPTPNTYDLALLDVMRDIAAVYASHPDYQQEWAL